MRPGNKLLEIMTLRFRRRITVIMALAWTAVCGAVLSLAGVYLYLNPQIPSAETYRHVHLETPLRVFTADGSLMAEFGERRVIPVTLTEVPPLFISAVLDTEDKRFYSHRGIDFISLLNDTLALLWKREITSGASTITMQLARNISFSLEQTFIRKFKEMLLALKIEQELSKDEILELYLNVIPFGKRAYGAEAAAVTYYGMPLAELRLEQLAMLAGIPQAPSAGNPINGPERALKRRNLVLGRMLNEGSITQEEYQTGIDAPITARVHRRELALAAPYAAEWVRRELLARYGRSVYSAGYEADTTIDASMQRAATHALREGLLRYDRRHGYRGKQTQIELPSALRVSSAAPAIDSPPIDSEEAPDEGAEPMSREAVIAQMTQMLAQYPASGGVEPALVLDALPDAFTALRASGEEIEVPIEHVVWAREFIDVNTRGPAVMTVPQVVAPGDVVHVRHISEGWALAQLPEIQGALVALDPQNGAVKALVGGFDFATNQYDHATQARRQPGSGFKPFVYSAALHHGVTPASIFLDAPLVFEDEALEDTYRPRNFGGNYNGPTRLREALYRSINLVSMRVLLEVGAGNVIDHVSRFGFATDEFPRNTQLAIGGGTIGITPLQMATAYAVFATGGYLVEPNIVTQVRSLDGEVIMRARHPQVCKPCELEAIQAARTAAQQPAEAPPDPLLDEPARMEDLFAEVDVKATDENSAPLGAEETAPLGAATPAPLVAERVLDERNAFIINSMLKDVIRRGTGVRAARALERLDIAGKTGTTNEADTWFNGYHKSLVATVWIGFSDNRAVGDTEFGSNLPLPVWIELMSSALPSGSAADREQPAGVLTLKIDPKTGRRAAPDQADAIFEFFFAEYSPPEEIIQPGLEGMTDADRVRAIDIF